MSWQQPLFDYYLLQCLSGIRTNLFSANWIRPEPRCSSSGIPRNTKDWRIFLFIYVRIFFPTIPVHSGITTPHPNMTIFATISLSVVWCWFHLQLCIVPGMGKKKKNLHFQCNHRVKLMSIEAKRFLNIHYLGWWN